MVISAIVLFFVSLLAFAISAVCGGGASFLLIPVLGWLLPGAQIPAALSIGTATSSVSRIVTFHSSIRWDIVVLFVPLAVPAVWLGAWLLTYVNPVYLEFILGLFLLCNLPLLFKSQKKEEKTTVKRSKWFLPVIGLMAGFVSGLTGAVGLLFNRFYLQYGLTKEEIIATRAANELLLHLIKIILYASFGLLTGLVIKFGILIAIAAVLSTLLVKKILPFISENIFKKTGYIAMVVAGLAMIFNASGTIINENNMQISYTREQTEWETKMKWKERTFEVDLEYDDGGFELEYGIQFMDLPRDKQEKAQLLSLNADKVVYEEVYGFNKHYYEVYVYKGGKLSKFDI